MRKLADPDGSIVENCREEFELVVVIDLLSLRKSEIVFFGNGLRRKLV